MRDSVKGKEVQKILAIGHEYGIGEKNTSHSFAPVEVKIKRLADNTHLDKIYSRYNTSVAIS